MDYSVHTLFKIGSIYGIYDGDTLRCRLETTTEAGGNYL